MLSPLRSRLAGLCLLSLNLLLSIASAGYTHVHDGSFVPDAVLRVTEQNITQSCLPSKPVVLVNGTAPGPGLRLKAGKTYWIRVYNDMPSNNLTMHWHGLTMGASPFSDGSPAASQWPIPPLHYFDYEVHIDKDTAGGTYFYHSHAGFQAVSCAGPLIIEDFHPPYHYDEERIIFLSDVFNKTDEQVEQGLIASPLNWSGETAMILTNGQGGGFANGTACNATLSTIDVEPNKIYRLRFIASTALTLGTLAIQGHGNLTVIEADGHYTKPAETSFLQLASGQRFSVLLCTYDKPAQSQYWIQIESRERPTTTQGFAILNYGRKPSAPLYPPATAPLTLPNITQSFLEYTLTPFYPDPHFPTAAEVTRRVYLTVHQAVRGATIWLENNYPWTMEFPLEPYLVSLYKNDGLEYPSLTRALANNGSDPVTRAFPAQIGEVIEIVIQNTGADANGLDVHPWHAHGKHYYDIGSGNGTYDAGENEKKLEKWRPIRRDTTMLYRYGTTVHNGTVQGWRAWRLRIEEPGVWMIHCHILQHMLMGMQTVWVMGNSSEVLDKVPRPAVEGYLTYGGNVNGNESHYPQVVHFDDYWAQNQR